MDGMGSSQTQHLMLDNLTVNPRIARRLSPVLAYRYHALPVAEANGQITVAMADPDDAVAREAVTSALGTPSCVVEGDPRTINSLLAEVWPEALQRPLRLLIYAQTSPVTGKVLQYARALGGLLDAQVTDLSALEDHLADYETLSHLVEQRGYDLVIWGEPAQTLKQQLLLGPAYRKATKQMTCSLLAARRPRWPLKHLLLVVRGEKIDDAAVEWVIRLARPSGADVTVLAVVPPVPAMYNRFARMQQGLDALLTTDTTLGRQMRQIARWLVEWELEGTLRLRQGTLDGQICSEIAEGDYDLVVIAARPYNRTARWLLGDRVRSLLRWADRPVLIAKPKTA